MLVSCSISMMAPVGSGLSSTPTGVTPPQLPRSFVFQKIRGVSVHPVPLRSSNNNKNYNDEDFFLSPFAFAASNVADLATVTAGAHQASGDKADKSRRTPPAASHINFLATQVWPSARSAAMALERHFSLMPPENKKTIVCEFGCGPGLPSLTAALLGAPVVYATDLDPFALELVQAAAECQGVSDRVTTKVLDLVHRYPDEIPWADLYLFSDVFESNAVAQGAARVAAECLERSQKQTTSVWVFAQSDRAQRDVFLHELRRLMDDPTLYWQPMTLEEQTIQSHQRLWLCDIDETQVRYG